MRVSSGERMALVMESVKTWEARPLMPKMLSLLMIRGMRTVFRSWAVTDLTRRLVW